MREELLRLFDDAVESARLGGITEAKKASGNYTPEDSRFFRHCHESIAEKRKKLRSLAEKTGAEPVAWMLRHSQTGKWLWDAEACVFGDASAANDRADCENESDDAEPWEAVPLYTAPPSQPVALPDGWVAVPREKLEQITDAIFSRHHNAKENGDAYETGYLGAMLEDLEGMLAAAPEVPRA